MNNSPSSKLPKNGSGGWFNSSISALLNFIVPGRLARVRELESARQSALEQKRSADALQRSREMLAQVIQAEPHAVFWKDRQSVFIGCNNAFARYVGLENPEQIAGKTDFDLSCTKAEAEAYRREDQEVMGNKAIRRDVVVQVKWADGSMHWVSSTKVPLVDGEGKVYGLVGLFDDITERKRVEGALKQSEAQYRALFSSMHEGFSLHEVICDSQNRPVDYRFLDVNPTFERITGIPRSRWVGRTVREVLPDIEPQWIERYGNVALTGNPVQYDDFSKALGRHYSVTAYCPQPGQVAVISWDVTQHKEAQEQERAARQRLALLVEQSPMAVIEWDLNYQVIGWNAAAERIFGHPRAEAIGRHGAELIVPPALRSQAGERFKALLVQKGNSEAIDTNVTKDGRSIICEWRDTALVDPSGQTIGVVSLAHDVTERTRTQEERQKLNTQMQQVQKLESLGVLAGGIAHDFNNLLMCILGNADLALADLPAMSPGREHIREIEQASRRAADLCRQMLAYSGKGRFVIEVISLSELVEEMVHLLKTSISKKALLNLNLEKRLPSFKGDATQVRQIVMNLVINASEAIGERSGVITISTGAMECTREYLREVYLDDNLNPGFYVWIEVSDTGSGMDSATVHRIFEPFFTTKFTGRGLGLSAVLGIVRGHKGALKVYSEPNKGTTFKVLFPASEEDAAVRKPAAGANIQRTFSGTILLVDDEETIRATGKMMLEKMGCKVLVAEDGRDALKVYSQHRDAVSVVLLDLTMPHLDGEETFRELRLLSPQIRVIMSSGYSEMDIASRFAGKGLAGFIQKPYTRAELINCLSSVVPESLA